MNSARKLARIGEKANGTVKPDRRTRRTREQLQKALIDLISERGYDAITIQDIVDRANLGRTTFYLHFTSKDDLFISCHESIVGEFRLGPLFAHPLTREELLAQKAPPGLEATYRHLAESWVRLSPIFQGKDGGLILRRVRDASAQEIEANLRAAFNGAESTVPLDVLANYLAGAQIALVQWWLEKHRIHSAETVAEMLHRLQRAAIHEAFGVMGDDEGYS